MNTSTSASTPLLTQQLLQHLQGAPLQQMAQRLGTDTAQTQSAVEMALPLLLVQRDGRMLSAWRSAALMALASPFNTALMGLLAALIASAARTRALPALLIALLALALLGAAAMKTPTGAEA